MLLQLGLREKVHERVNSLYASQKVLQKRLQDFAEEGKDPRDVRLADIEPDIDTRIFLIKKKLWELKQNDTGTNRTDS